MKSKRIAAALAALLLAAALAGCAAVTGDYLGAEPTVESEVISEPTENAVQAAIAADDARNNASYTIGEGSVAEPATSDITWQQAANAAEAAFEAVGGAPDGESWTLAYFPPDQTGERGVYSCGLPVAGGTAFLRLDSVTADVVMMDLPWPDTANVFDLLSLTGQQRQTLQQGGQLTAQEYAQIDELYQPIAAKVNAWLTGGAENYLAQLAPAFGFDADSIESHAEKWPDGAQEFLEQFYSPFGQPTASWVVTILGEKYELDADPYLQKVFWMVNYMYGDERPAPAADASAAEAAAEAAQIDGWYEQAADGTWYHVGPDGKPDGQ